MLVLRFIIVLVLVFVDIDVVDAIQNTVRIDAVDGILLSTWILLSFC